jgi:hypothetical protein
MLQEIVKALQEIVNCARGCRYPSPRPLCGAVDLTCGYPCRRPLPDTGSQTNNQTIVCFFRHHTVNSGLNANLCVV